MDPRGIVRKAIQPEANPLSMLKVQRPPEIAVDYCLGTLHIEWTRFWILSVARSRRLGLLQGEVATRILETQTGASGST
jgi:hypothetical protein